MHIYWIVITNCYFKVGCNDCHPFLFKPPKSGFLSRSKSTLDNKMMHMCELLRIIQPNQLIFHDHSFQIRKILGLFVLAKTKTLYMTIYPNYNSKMLCSKVGLLKPKYCHLVQILKTWVGHVCNHYCIDPFTKQMPASNHIVSIYHSCLVV